jgi:uncharacterized membrane protein YcgQ (UPF0703/DUF1980 family)
MRFGKSAALLLLAATLAACSNTIPAINARPAQYYEKKVAFTGRIDRTQALVGETLLEIADADAHRILVRTDQPLEAAVGDWVKVKGILVAEGKVGGRVVPDLVVADSIDKTRAPLLRNLL